MARSKRNRPRGFATWNPQRAGQEIVAAAQDVLDEYSAYLPMTLRQIFYRLVVKYAIEKTERGYKRLCEHMNRARRAKLISMGSIRDDGMTLRMAHDFESEGQVREYLKDYASNARMDLQRGQPVRVELWCEAAGMVPQLEKVAHPYGVPVISSGGFDSLTAKHDMAERYACHDRTLVLHLGDFDPSGVHIFSSLSEDIKAFTFELSNATSFVDFVRLAVLPEHIDLYGLPSAPPKKTDRRSFNDTRTVQAEAFSPELLAELVESAIRSHLDLSAYQRALAYQSEVRKRLGECP